MLNNKKTIVVVALFGVALGPLCWMGRAQGTTNEKLPMAVEPNALLTPCANPSAANEKLFSAVELLDKYTESQDKLKSIVARGETSGSTVALRDDDKEEYASRMFSEFRTEGSRLYHHYWKLTESHSTDQRASDSIVPERYAFESLRLYDGKYTFHFQKSGRVRIELEDGEDGVPTPPPLSYRGRELLGYFFPDRERVDSILRRSEKLSVRDKLERVGRSKCYVIDAVTDRGRYTLWIDLEHGYNIAKAQKEAGDSRLPEGSKYSSLKNVKFEKIDGVWVPMEGDMEFGYQIPGKDYREKRHHKRREVILNPDHEALRSFYPDDIPSGREVDPGAFVQGTDIEGGPDLDFDDDCDVWVFRWQAGAQFMVNERCRVVRKDYNKHALPIVKVLDIGQLVRHFKVAPAPVTTEGKHIVLCLWDINQKQSHQLLQALRDRQQALSKKGVSVIVVEASGAKTDKVHSWAEQNKLTFPVGAFYSHFERSLSRWIKDREEDGEKVDMDDRKKREILDKVVTALRKIWAADKLPWLILTDCKHVVTGEGFALEELEEKIKEIETF